MSRIFYLFALIILATSASPANAHFLVPIIAAIGAAIGATTIKALVIKVLVAIHPVCGGFGAASGPAA